MAGKENWSSKFGVILAVAGSAVGLGNFLRFPGQAVNNGGGAFMIPYIICFFVIGVPIAWCEWTMGRLGGRYGQNNGPGILYALWPRWPSKVVGAMTIMIPIGIYMYYVLLEAWCLDYCIEFFSGGFADLFANATAGAADYNAEVQAVVGATNEHWQTTFGMGENGILFREGGRTIWLVLTCFLVNFFIIYHGVTRGIEVFCKWAMPMLIACAVVILVRVLTLQGISSGLGFMWNPQWDKLGDWQVWLAAAGQIFFSLSVGFGLILCYSSYLRKDDDVVLTALSASSANEFCEVLLGGMIVIPTAFLFLGAANATGGTFGLGFITIPAIMKFMPGGNFFGGMWFGLLFLAAVTSSLSMLQPAIAFLEDAFGMGRRASVTVLGIITACGSGLVMFFSRGLVALDHTDFWCNLMMVVAATFQVLLFGWIIGAKRGVREMNRGSDLKLPNFMAVMIRYVTPAFLIIILVMWSIEKLPGKLQQLDPVAHGTATARGVYEAAIHDRYSESKLDEKAMKAKVVELLGPPERAIDSAALQPWLAEKGAQANEAREKAAGNATVSRFVFIGILALLGLLIALSDIGCRNRIGRVIKKAEQEGVQW